MDLVLQQMAGTDQPAVEVLYRCGFSLHANAQYEEASAVFRVMLRVAPTDERGWVALGDCHEKLGQRHVALELYSAGTIAAAPAPRCHLSQFRTLYDQNRMTDAECAYERALQIATSTEDELLISTVQNERRGRP